MITAIGDVMRQCYARGWITTRDGNASLRRANSPYIYVTPSGVRKNKIEVESIIKMRMDNGEIIIPPGTTPSGELHMHLFLQRFAKRTRSVLHVHPTHVVAAIYAGFELDKVAAEFPEISRYTRVAPNVPILPAVSMELAQATALALEGKMNVSSNPADHGDLLFDIVGQANHGVCSVAGDPWSAYEHIERLDHICEIVLKSGVPELISMDHIDAQAQDAFENFQEADSVFMSLDVYAAFEKNMMSMMQYSGPGSAHSVPSVMRIYTTVGELAVKKVPQLSCFCYVGTEKSLQHLEWIRVGQAFEKEIFGVDP